MGLAEDGSVGLGWRKHEYKRKSGKSGETEVKNWENPGEKCKIRGKELGNPGKSGKKVQNPGKRAGKSREIREKSAKSGEKTS